MIYIGPLLIEITEAPGKKFKLSVHTKISGVSAEVTRDDVRALLQYLEKQLTEGN